MAHKVFVGLSGGVDSAVSAALLKERGFDVTGVFIKIWRAEFLECTWKEDRLDAMRVCAALSIPFREIDLSDEYKKEVVDPMLREYSQGRTPNPDVLCNRAVKFGAFLKWARAEGADLIATGHYARIRQHGGHFELLRGADAQKDQSYFLYRLGQADLARTLFPVGGMKKSAVRAKALARGLPVAHKRDSQGLCFVGDVAMPDFLGRFIPVERGSVRDMRGAVIGEHAGAALYTIGERHGFTITDDKIAHVPHYVVRVEPSTNTLVVSAHRADAERTQAQLSDVHWVHRAPHPDAPIEVQARYREQPVAARLKGAPRGIAIVSAQPHLFPPGQSLVVYQNEVCLGGGIIETPEIARTPVKMSTPPAVGSRVPQVQ